MPLIDARTRVRIVVSFVLMLSSYSSNEHPCASRIFFFSTLFFVKYSRIKKNARCYGDSYDARVGVEGIGQSKIEINTVLGLFVLDFPFPKKKERKKERGDYILSPQKGRSNFIVRRQEKEKVEVEFITPLSRATTTLTDEEIRESAREAKTLRG